MFGVGSPTVGRVTSYMSHLLGGETGAVHERSLWDEFGSFFGVDTATGPTASELDKSYLEYTERAGPDLLQPFHAPADTGVLLKGAGPEQLSAHRHSRTLRSGIHYALHRNVEDIRDPQKERRLGTFKISLKNYLKKN